MDAHQEPRDGEGGAGDHGHPQHLLTPEHLHERAYRAQVPFGALDRDLDPPIGGLGAVGVDGEPAAALVHDEVHEAVLIDVGRGGTRHPRAGFQYRYLLELEAAEIAEDSVPLERTMRSSPVPSTPRLR